MRFPSRNKATIHDDYFVCCNCKKRNYYHEISDDYVEKYSENTKIYYCKYCDSPQIPNVTRYVDYVYSGRCRNREKEKE